MKPSEQFSRLLETAMAMEDCSDKVDLLALFELADSLYCITKDFGRVVDSVKTMLKKSNKQFKELIEWRMGRKGMIEIIEKEPLRRIK